MSKFKIGDVVTRVRGFYRGMGVGDVDIVVGVSPQGVQLKKTTPKKFIGNSIVFSHDVENLEKVRSIVLENK